MEKKAYLKIFVSAILAFAFLAIMPQFAHAASLYFSPFSGSHAVGTTLSVSVYVSSADQAMNAASGVISFPSDKLEVTSLSKTGSIFSLWVQEPSFSNPPAGGQGTVNFEGIALNPGFTGVSGKLITANFRIKAAGVAALNFSSGSVLANDGQGTNILTSLGNAQFSLGGAIELGAPESVTPVELAGVPRAPEISSPTHPDPNKWYAASSAKFNWNVTKDITAVRLLVGRIPQAIPAITYTSPINSKEITDLDDGIWYFSVRLKNSAGWGGVSHFRFQIDTKPPEPFTIKFVDGKETENPGPTVLFDTADYLSGIDYYKIKIGEGDFFSVASETVKSNPYTLHPQAPGKRNILVQAFDRAGNYAVATEEFVIKPLKEPVFTEYPKELESNSILMAQGKSQYPNSQIIVWLQRENDQPKDFSVRSDRDGKFTFVSGERLRDGIYMLWAEAVDERGAKSGPSEKLTIAVKRPAFLQIGAWAVSVLAVVVPFIALIILLLFVVWYGWHKFSMFRKKLKKEVREAESALHKAFDLLKEDIREQVKMLEKTKNKRELTEEEEKVIEQLKKDLDDAEKFVRKEIEDIEEVVK